MTLERRREIRRRARQIRKATKPKATFKDYLQITLVILVILAIVATAVVLTGYF